MIYTIKEMPEFKIIEFTTGKKVAGAHSVDLEKLLINIYNYDTEELEEKKLRFGGLDADTRTIYVEFLK